MEHVIVVEDEPQLGEDLVRLMESAGFRAEQVSSGREALDRLARTDCDAAILDLGLPDLDGIEVLDELRRGAQSALPVLVLTGDHERVEEALDRGADDYVMKPFSSDELVARIRALIRRASRPRWSPLACGDVVLHPDDRLVTVAGKAIELSARQRRLLEYLLRRQNQIVTRDEILLAVFDTSVNPGTNVVDVHVAHLRRKLSGGRLVVRSIRGIGYSLRSTTPHESLRDD
jgi:two-component system OmpR family response regulator